MKPLAIQDIQRGPSVLTEVEPSDRHEIPYFDPKYCLSDIHSLPWQMFPITRSRLFHHWLRSRYEGVSHFSSQLETI